MTDRWTKIAPAAEALLAGDLVAFPPETVYGLGGDATRDKSVAAIFAAKGRPSFNPLILHVTDFSEAEKFGNISAGLRTLADKFWPDAKFLAHFFQTLTQLGVIQAFASFRVVI